MEKSSGDRENGWEREDVPVERERSFSLKCSGGMERIRRKKEAWCGSEQRCGSFPFSPRREGDGRSLEKG